MSVNEKIRLIRESKGLTQEDVAKKLDISVNSYGDIERGNTNLKLNRLEQIAKILEISLPELIDTSDKGILNINFKNKQRDVYFGSSNTELKEQLLINALQKKELAMKDRENDNLREIIALLKREPTQRVD